MGLLTVMEAVETMQKKNIRLAEEELEFVLQFAIATGDKELTEKLIEELADTDAEREAIFTKYQTLTGFRPEWIQKIELLLIALERYQMQGQKSMAVLEEILVAYGVKGLAEEVPELSLDEERVSEVVPEPVMAGR